MRGASQSARTRKAVRAGARIVRFGASKERRLKQSYTGQCSRRYGRHHSCASCTTNCNADREERPNSIGFAKAMMRPGTA